MIRRNFVLLFGFIGLLGCDKTIYLSPDAIISQVIEDEETVELDGDFWTNIIPSTSYQISTVNNVNGNLLITQTWLNGLSATYTGSSFIFCSQSQMTFGSGGGFSSLDKSTNGEWYGAVGMGGHSALKFIEDNGTAPWVSAASFNTNANSACYYNGDIYTCGGSGSAVKSTSNPTVGSSIVGSVNDIIEYKGKLIAAGNFDFTGNSSIENIAQWDGNQWQPLGLGLDGTVFDLEIYDGKLVAGGSFNASYTDYDCRKVALWDGNVWKALGEGIGGFSTVYKLRSNGNHLIIGGNFDYTVDQTYCENIVKWTGTEYKPFPNGVPLPVGQIAIWNGKLYIANRNYTSSDNYLLELN